MNIIVVDDEMNILKDFLENIVDYGEIKCSMFMNDLDALITYVKNNNVDAAFLDIVMPNADGVDLARKILSINPKIQIVFITGYAQDEEKIKNELGDNVVGFCYKPYSKDRLYEYIAEINDSLHNNRKIVAKTFGAFDLQIEGKSVTFNLTKSKEMLAYLVYRQGQLVSMPEMISVLWPDHDVDKAKLLYRNAKSRLDLILRHNHIEHIVQFYRGKAKINTDTITCDLCDFLKDEENLSYNYEFLIDYEWSLDMQNRLDLIINRRLNKNN